MSLARPRSYIFLLLSLSINAVFLIGVILLLIPGLFRGMFAGSVKQQRVFSVNGSEMSGVVVDRSVSNYEGSVAYGYNIRMNDGRDAYVSSSILVEVGSTVGVYYDIVSGVDKSEGGRSVMNVYIYKKK